MVLLGWIQGLVGKGSFPKLTDTSYTTGKSESLGFSRCSW